MGDRRGDGRGAAGLNLVNSQAVLHLTDLGISQITAGAAIGTVGLFSIGGRLLGGVLGDRFEPRFLVATGLLGQAVGLLVLLVADQPALVYGFTVLFGAGFGLGIVAAPLMMANYYGAGSFARINGITGVLTISLGAFGPVLAGYSSDALGSYTAVFVGFSVTAVLVALAVLVSRPPQPAQPA